MEGADINMWSSFLPSVMRAVLGEGGQEQPFAVLKLFWFGMSTGKQ